MNKTQFFMLGVYVGLAPLISACATATGVDQFAPQIVSSHVRRLRADRVRRECADAPDAKPGDCTQPSNRR